jgi:molecular chaperone DnaK
VEKALKDLGEKVSAEERAKAESALSDLKSALKSDDKELIEKKTEALGQASASIAQRAYAATAEAGGAGAGGGAGAQGQAGPGAEGAAGSQGKPEENVVDAEFEEVRDKNRRAS